jgi:pyruvate/2-oxoglutarate dehydrogenase complex dihydrolipoamide acyltransferase (E2) component
MENEVATEIKMPDLGTTTDEIKLVQWLVNVGDAVHRGQPLAEVETDKAATEVESVASGTVTALLAEAGDTITTGQLIATVE